MLMRSALFWDVTRRRVVMVYFMHFTRYIIYYVIMKNNLYE
jgi:hypothetical protein